MTLQSASGSSSRAMPRQALVIAALSTAVEWYDFTLYLYLATVLSRVFFGGGTSSLSAALASFAVAYLVRPLGAGALGHIGDRYGRRRMMLVSMGMMTCSMVATALLPTRAQVGPLSGYLLLAIRCVMGFSVGGEYNGVVAYLLEGAPRHRRGLVVSMASSASELGGLGAVAISALAVNLLSPEDLDAWGWRLPFAFGALLAAIVWYARSKMPESPDFERQEAEDRVPKNPLRQIISKHPQAIANGFAISSLGSITYYVGITYVPTFLTLSGHMSEGKALQLSTLAAMVAILATPIAGILSDRFGRRPVLLVLGAAAAFLPAAMFGLMDHPNTLRALVGAIVLAAIGGGVSAVGAVATAEQLPGEGRLSGLALGASAATALFGGVMPYVSQRLLEYTGWHYVPGALIAVVALVVLPVLWFSSETRPQAKAG